MIVEYNIPQNPILIIMALALLGFQVWGPRLEGSIYGFILFLQLPKWKF